MGHTKSQNVVPLLYQSFLLTLKIFIMATVKLVLRKKKNKDGTYPLAIRVTKDRNSSYVHLGYSVKETQWDSSNHVVKKSHPNSERLNNLLLKKLSEASNKVLELETQKNDVPLRAVKKVL